jgi:hypothetical protein
MKRYWSTPEYRLRQERRIRKFERRRLATGTVRTPGVGRLVEIPAPEVLSVFGQPDETIAFCNELRQAAGGYKNRVFIDLRNVKRFTSDALLLMRAIIEDKGARGFHSNVGGNLPLDPVLAAKLKATGFFAGFKQPPGDLPQPLGLIMKKSSRQVHSEIAAALVRFALSESNIPRPVAEASYQNLVEAMTNTRKHARGADPKERRRRVLTSELRPWFASVYCEDGTAYFTIVDLGVGILKSAQVRHLLRQIGYGLDVYGRPKLLADLFCGLIGSSTGDPGRGQGLPKMKQDADAGRLPQLHVATTTVSGRVSDLRFKSTRSSIKGTLLRWRSDDRKES